MRQLLSIVLFGGALVALLMLAVVNSEDTKASAADRIGQVALDMDPTGQNFGVANTSHGLGDLAESADEPVQQCAQINQDGDTAGDADEDATDVVYVDVVATAGGVPAARLLGAIQFDIVYDPAKVEIVDVVGGGGHHDMLGTSAGAALFGAADDFTLNPGTDTDGTFTEAVAFNGILASGE